MSIVSTRHNYHSIYRLQGGERDATDRNIWQPAPVDHIPTQKKGVRTTRAPFANCPKKHFMSGAEYAIRRRKNYGL